MLSPGGGGGGGGSLWDIIGTDVRVSIWKTTPIIYLAFLKKNTKKHSLFIYCVYWGGGGGSLWDIIGTDVRVSIWKTTPIIYLAFLKKKKKNTAYSYT